MHHNNLIHIGDFPILHNLGMELSVSGVLLYFIRMYRKKLISKFWFLSYTERWGMTLVNALGHLSMF